MQDHTEEVWRRNARNVAESVRGTWKQYAARVVVLAGDVRARAEVFEALSSADSIPVVETESGSRAEGSSQDALWSEVGERLEELRRENHMDLSELNERSGQDRAVGRGLSDVLFNLARGQVERVLMTSRSRASRPSRPTTIPGWCYPASA